MQKSGFYPESCNNQKWLFSEKTQSIDFMKGAQQLPADFPSLERWDSFNNWIEEETYFNQSPAVCGLHPGSPNNQECSFTKKDSADVMEEAEQPPTDNPPYEWYDENNNWIEDEVNYISLEGADVLEEAKHLTSSTSELVLTLNIL